jgi:carboxyl-terminal processing protease
MPVRPSPLLALLLPLALVLPSAVAQESAPTPAQETPAAQGEAPTADPATPASEPPADASPANDAAPEQAPPAGAAPQDAPPDDGDAKVPDIAASDDPDAAESTVTGVPLEEIRRYVGLFNAIRLGYVDPVEDRKLMDSAIRGLLLDLDPHSAYLKQSDAEAFNEGTTGAYDGIGVEVLQLPDGKVRVIAPIDDTPAAKAGIRAGDTIVSVDGKPLVPADAEGSGPLRGPSGTVLVLGVVREGEAAPLEISVRRETIKVASVRGRMLEPGYGYVRISQFQVETADDFARTVERLQGEAGGRLKGLVIDLRSNPGGLLTSAVRIADDLLEKGGIVSTRGRIRVNDTEFNATPGDLMRGAPVAVIIDAGSASASEVLAGALRDNGRARIVGSRSFGKGSVQTVMPLGNGDAVKLTTARYYTPSGRSIQARGIDPDVVLKPDSRGPELLSTVPGYTEAALPGHLRGDEEDGSTAGDVLDGDGPINAALAELKKSALAVAPASE